MDINKLELISHRLCPYVQRSVIALVEHKTPFIRTDICLADKPKWFLDLSPTGKVPLLRINDEYTIFESSVICEFINDTATSNLLPSDPIAKAHSRSLIEFASQLLNLVAKYYSATDEDTFNEAKLYLQKAFVRLDAQIVGPFFSGRNFSMVDAAFGPVFRYFDVFEARFNQHLLKDYHRLRVWRNALSKRPSVINAVGEDYEKELFEFLKSKNSYLASLAF